MPEFANPFSGFSAVRKATDAELVRAIRFMIAAEYEAVQLYMQLAESTDNRLAQEVLKDIANEEVVHAGEFLKLLQELEPTETAFYAEGEAEVREIMAKIAAGVPESTVSERRPVPGAETQENESGEEGSVPQVPSVGSLVGK